ncbi:MAG: hypothetical protein IH934_02980 [Nanoarchaeota archaeon]|nr:hypothetical protein [Nanoarchaeota archaeon]
MLGRTKEISNTISIEDLFQIIDQEIKSKDFDPKDAKLAKATCRDDSIEEISHEALKHGYINPGTNKYMMRLETAAAVPTYGEGLIEAFYHHIPDKGVGVIIFAPHFGIDSKGRIGYLDREGQSEVGKSCGANHGVLELWKTGQYGPYENNLELSEISNALAADRQQIIESQEPIRTMAEHEYASFLKKLTGYVISVQNKEHHKFPILIAGGINIDTHRDTNNQFSLQNLTWIIDGKVTEANYKK